MFYGSKSNKRNFVIWLASTGTSFANNPADKRNAIILNYFSVVLFLAAILLLIIQKVFFNFLPDPKIIITALLFLFPLFFNRFGFLFLARLSLCWLPTIAVMTIYITEAMKKVSMIL